MKTGVYDFVLIANDDVDAVKTQLDALTIGNSRIGALNDLSFASTSFDDDTCIPMVSVVRGVKVYPEGRIELPSSDDQDEGIFSPQDKTWYVSLKRLAVRVDLKIKLSAGQTVDASKKLLIDKVPTCVYLLPDENNEGYEEEPREYDVPSAVGGELIWKRIILPESMFSEIADSEKGVQILLTVNDVECMTVIGFDTSVPDYTLPRNTYLDIEATANPQQQALDYSATVVDWTKPAQNVIADGPYWLTVSEDDFLIYAWSNDAIFTAKTNYNLTTDKQGYPAGLQISTEYPSDVSDWLTFTGGTDDDTERTVTLTATANLSKAPRTAKVKVKAGNMTKIINVTQPAEDKVFAAPGVIGIRVQDYFDLLAERVKQGRNDIYLGDLPGNRTLTIKGSKSYKETWVETNVAPKFGGLDADDVYTVYFKWGSMVAMIGGTDDPWSTDGSDVVWVNKDFDRTTTPITTYASFTPALTQGTFGDGNNVVAAPDAGHGDPCSEVDGGSGSWKTPTGKPFTLSGETYSNTSGTVIDTNTPFGVSTSTSPIAWAIARNDTNKAVTYWNSDSGSIPTDLNPVERAPVISIGIAPNGQVVSDNQDLFLPVAGCRNNSTGAVNTPELGYYWSSTAYNGDYGYNLSLRKADVVHNSSGNNKNGFAVRCVRVQP